MGNLWIVESCVFAVGGVAGFAAAEVSGRDGFAIAFHAQQLDEPGFVLDFFVQDAGCHVIRPRIFAEGHVAHRAPASDGAALGLH